MAAQPGFDISKWTLTIREELDHSLETLDQSLIGLMPELESEAARTRLDVARRQVKRFKDLMENLSYLINEREQQYFIHVARGRFDTYFEQVLLPYRNFCKRRNITLKVEVNEGPEGFFAFERLSKIAETLLINAIEFCDQTDGRVTISLQHNPNTNSWSLAVQDNGIGIRKEKLPHIFDPNYAGDDLHLRHFQGVSLGLFLAKTYARSLKGDLEVISEAQVFSRFELHWPHAGSLEVLPFKNYKMDESLTAVAKDTTDTLQRSLFGQLAVNNGQGADNYLIALCKEYKDAEIATVLGTRYTVVYCRDVATALARALYFSPRALFIVEDDYPDIPAAQLARSLRLNSATAALPMVWWGKQPPPETDKNYTGSRLSTFDSDLLAFLDRAETRAAGLKKGNRIKAKSTGEQFLEKIDAILEANLGNVDFGPSELAGLLFIDRSQLHRKLKKLKNLNCSAYIRNYRLRRAHEELQLGRMNVSEVASWSGFASTSYFSTCFHKLFGAKPSTIVHHDRNNVHIN